MNMPYLDVGKDDTRIPPFIDICAIQNHIEIAFVYPARKS